MDRDELAGKVMDATLEEGFDGGLSGFEFKADLPDLPKFLPTMPTLATP
ncbi:hypothetical protein CCP1ISM_340001 [Azospirillaceae bacterium]